MVDVDCAVGYTPCLTAADDSAYEIDEAEVIYWGRCPECVAANASDQVMNHRTARADGGPTVSESENPAIDAPEPKTGSAEDEPGLVAEPARPVGAPPALAARQPDGRGLRLRRGVRDASTSRR